MPEEQSQLPTHPTNTNKRRFILIILAIIIGVCIVTTATAVPIILTRRANTT
ncbi:unnamed protein product, partial [Rotaria sordida]